MPVVDSTQCSGCSTCIEVCAAEAISLDPGISKAVIDPDLCIECYSCKSICPRKAISEAE